MTQWKRTSEYSIASVCGRWHIAKLLAPDGAKYLLWDKTEIVDRFDTPDEAKKAAHREGR